MKRFIYILSVFCLIALFFQTAQAQTVNRKLYLKSGNLMDRTVGSTKVNSGTFSKAGVIKDAQGEFTTGPNQTASSTLSGSHITTSNSNRLMIVSVGSHVPSPSSPRVDSIKYGTQKLTLLDSVRINDVKIDHWDEPKKYEIVKNIGIAMNKIDHPNIVKKEVFALLYT